MSSTIDNSYGSSYEVTAKMRKWAGIIYENVEGGRVIKSTIVTCMSHAILTSLQKPLTKYYKFFEKNPYWDQVLKNLHVASPDIFKVTII